MTWTHLQIENTCACARFKAGKYYFKNEPGKYRQNKEYTGV